MTPPFVKNGESNQAALNPIHVARQSLQLHYQQLELQRELRYRRVKRDFDAAFSNKAPEYSVCYMCKVVVRRERIERGVRDRLRSLHRALQSRKDFFDKDPDWLEKEWAYIKNWLAVKHLPSGHSRRGYIQTGHVSEELRRKEEKQEKEEEEAAAAEEKEREEQQNLPNGTACEPLADVNGQEEEEESDGFTSAYVWYMHRQPDNVLHEVALAYHKLGLPPSRSIFNYPVWDHGCSNVRHAAEGCLPRGKTCS
ncbi:hypothetical protein ACRE_009390 [Hapsidospora chrysogenum ATCC 11550]|uniref:Uncharacterized protein n=1 Tax=Hapsidospora chrysogenum (strain ATCC 11550 / CBS 779.69 / DSM 880 / IAM 14645 / JCM 23072 / IMI 49137) TaxID=857340 RepID=A0A086TG47_HAPC1|nr:hypothetical protein ACRE_009390 [Hapsidospora chrysogenum ATCC 11550]